METIGDRIRRLREQKGIARKDLARGAGLSYSGLSDLESGKAKSTTRLHHLAELLEVTVGYLETGKEYLNTPLFRLINDESLAMRLDPEMIAECYTALSEIYQEELGRAYDLSLEPERFVLVYEARSRMSKNPSASEERRFGAKVAEIVRLTGAELHGQRNDLPTEGNDPGQLARRIRRKKG